MIQRNKQTLQKEDYKTLKLLQPQKRSRLIQLRPKKKKKENEKDE